jgi:hypothetical protein
MKFTVNEFNCILWALQVLRDDPARPKNTKKDIETINKLSDRLSDSYFQIVEDGEEDENNGS